VLSVAVPESEKWGIDAVHAVVAAGRDLGWRPDPMLRLMAITPPSIDRVKELAARLKLSTAERERLEHWAAAELPQYDLDNQMFARSLYRSERKDVEDKVRLALADARSKAISDDTQMMRAAGYSRLLDFAENWERPQFPVAGADLIASGMRSGPQLGAQLKALEERWVDSGFGLTKADLLKFESKAI
jgi:poly(A) polymerase